MSYCGCCGRRRFLPALFRREFYWCLRCWYHVDHGRAPT